jgi:O-methyltransferase
MSVRNQNIMPQTLSQERKQPPFGSVKGRIRSFVPKAVLLFVRLFRTGDGKKMWSFLIGKDSGLSFRERLVLVYRFNYISRKVECQHLESEILAFACEVFKLPATVGGCLVEAGCFKGGGTAKLSIVATLSHRELVVCDSFEGIPENREDHGTTLFGGGALFRAGDYRGDLEEVKGNVRDYGEIRVCRFVKGYFEDTLTDFRDSVAAAYIDADLASSTRTCLKYLWPLLAPGGVIFSQDGHLPLVLDVLRDKAFWQSELGCGPPEVIGLGLKKLVWFRKLVTIDAACRRAGVIA